jgi:hypothetical protein
MFGFSERFHDFAYDRAGDVDFVCFTDDPALRSNFWNVRPVSRGLLDPARAAKQFKALPHRFLPEFDWSLYVDNTVKLNVTPKRLFEFLADSASPLVCFRHPQRNCVFDEADRVLELNLDDPERVRPQMRLYLQLGYPRQNGLAKGAFILRRHHDATLIPVMEHWHQQVLCHSKRDQLSLNPVMWFDGFSPTYLDQHFLESNLLHWPVVEDGIRVPRDFDDERYLEINPDVTMDARLHYLLQGAAEGRRYK